MIATAVILVTAGLNSHAVGQDVRTRLDPAGIHRLVAERATVEELLALRPAPRQWGLGRRHRHENALVEVDAEVIGIQVAPAGDVRALIRGEHSEVMVAEFPDAPCTVPSDLFAQMCRARLRFLELAQQRVRRLRLTGVVFFGEADGRNQGAGNGVELHPILSVEPHPENG